MSDVPLGVFLSGGLDSSCIAATVAPLVEERLKTFSVGFESQYYSEFSFAREVASKINSDHFEVVLTPHAFLQSLPKLVWHEDEPIRSAPSVALYHVAALAREHVKVVLTGEGSDELFAGYDRYWATLFNLKWAPAFEAVVPRFIRDRCIRQTLWKWPIPTGMKRKLSHTFLGLDLRPEQLVFDNWYAIFPRSIHSQLFTNEFYREVKDVEPYADCVRFYERPAVSKLEQHLYADQKTYLVELLRKQDRMSMATSIESRVPFLDHRIVEFSSSVPQSLKLNRFAGKEIVKLAMSDRLPKSIRDRKKTGFPVPLRNWLTEIFGQTLKAFVLSEQSVGRGIINSDFVRRLFDEQATGKTRPHRAVVDVALF